MIQQIAVHKRLKENAMKFDSLLQELDGLKFMSMKTKQFYEITGYQNSLRSAIELELYNSQAETSDSEFLYVILEDSTVETAIAAVYEQGLVPVVVVYAEEETEDDDPEEECDCPICTAEKESKKEPYDLLSDILEKINRMQRGQ